jgi:hypothetical protein
MLVLATVLCALLALPLPLLAAHGGEAAAPAWRVHITPAGELFPALELSQRPGVAGGSGLVRVDIEAATAHGALVLTLETAGLRHPARLAIPAGAAGTQTLRPRLEWDPAALEELDRPRRQPLVATLEGAGRPAQVRRLEVLVHPLDEALYYVREGRDAVDLGWAFAGYVDPHDPAIDALLARARELAPGLERLPARNRAEAIWRALEWRELRYAHGDPAIARGPVLWSQRVQPPHLTWHARRGSCIDASVLVASALERMGLAPFILLVPGHALVGLDAAGAEPLLLETTALGRLATPQENFAAALASGARQWRAALPHLRRGGGPDYACIDIAPARRYGIMPLRSGVAEQSAPAPRGP